MEDRNTNEVANAVEYIKGLVQQLCEAGMPPSTVDNINRSMKILEEAANKSLNFPPVTMSSVALRKANQLAMDGFTVCGFALEKEGNSSAVMFDSAVRWLSPEERRLLMCNEGSKVIEAARADAEPLPEGGISDDAIDEMVKTWELRSKQGVEDCSVLMGLAREVRAKVYRSGPVAGLKRARLMVSEVENLLKTAEGQGFGKVTVALVRKTMEPYLPLADQDFIQSVEPSLLTAARAVVDAARGEYLSSSMLRQLAEQCELAMKGQARAVEAFSSNDVKALLACAIDDASGDASGMRQDLLLEVAAKIGMATLDDYSGRLVDSVRRTLAHKQKSAQ